MATEEPQAPEGFDDAAPEQNYDEEEPTIELESGETLMGLVLDVTEGSGQYGPWYRLRIKDTENDRIVKYFARDEVKTALKADTLGEGDEVWIARGTQEVEIDEGGSYLPTKCKVRGDS